MRFLRSGWFWMFVVAVGAAGYAVRENPELQEWPPRVPQWVADLQQPKVPPRRRSVADDLAFDASEDVAPNASDDWGLGAANRDEDSLDVEEPFSFSEIDARLDGDASTKWESGFAPKDRFADEESVAGNDLRDDDVPFGEEFPFDDSGTGQDEMVDVLDSSPDLDTDSESERDLDPSWMYELELFRMDEPYPDESESLVDEGRDRDAFDPVLEFDPMDVELGDSESWGRIDSELPTDPALELDVVAPVRAQRGVETRFRVLVRNMGTDATSDVRLQAEFDGGLEMPGRSDRVARKTFGTIPPGETREVTLVLRGTEIGQQCARFVLSAGDREVESQRTCLDVREHAYDVRVLGPRRRTVGDRAEYAVLLTNVSTEPMLDVRVTVRHDESLEPRAGTRGALIQPGRLMWTFARVEPSETIQLQADLGCLREMESARVTVDLEADGVVRSSRERTLHVEPVRDVEVRLLDDDDPLTIGDETTLRLSVSNPGSRPLERVVVRMKKPDGLEITGSEVVRDKQPLKIRSRQRGDVLEFAILPELEAGESIVYRIGLRGTASGEYEIRTLVEHGRRDQTVPRSEWLIVNEK